MTRLKSILLILCLLGIWAIGVSQRRPRQKTFGTSPNYVPTSWFGQISPDPRLLHSKKVDTLTIFECQPDSSHRQIPAATEIVPFEDTIKNDSSLVYNPTIPDVNESTSERGFVKFDTLYLYNASRERFYPYILEKLDYGPDSILFKVERYDYVNSEVFVYYFNSKWLSQVTVRTDKLVTHYFLCDDQGAIVNSSDPQFVIFRRDAERYKKRLQEK